MAGVPAWRSAVRVCAWLATAGAGVALVGAASVVVSGWLIDGVERANGDRQTATERSMLGDYFGAVSAVFSGLALLLLVTTLLFQQRELQLQRRELALQREELAASRAELRRSAAADLRGLHVQLTQMQMEDPALAEVWNDFPGQPHAVIRQHLFANLTYSHLLLAFQWGDRSEEDLLHEARDIVRSPAFRSYWAASRSLKASLPADSDEGRMFRLFERAIAETGGGDPPA
ncbi:DUF6082 family protein [Streptomyces sp. NBC_00287]|uniref:DUF6082 family protein n=1 Tax=Streptomyces sp. NBC_00287 TaxID=2975702 RepID=UPI002E290738|nr:DUF6082 family protein [Streptomyces sp. NBC_00287]